MALNHPAWLTTPRVAQLLRKFPLPLVVLSEGGVIDLLNDQFVDRFDPSSLPWMVPRDGIVVPPGRWPVTLRQRDGTEVTVSAHALVIEDRTLLVLDAQPGGEPIENLAQLHTRILELERASATDRLTGAWNRAHLDRVISGEISRCAQYRQPLSLVLVDIDHFKRVNDTHGHQAGDEVLKHLVSLVRARTRAADLLFRWGGEEFVLLVATAGHRAAEKVAQGLRSAVAAETFPTVGALTISVGVAEVLPGEDAASWFGRADAMLYAAKHGGRDRVCVDPRGSSDAWAAEHGRSALRLEWSEAYESGEPTIDRQHRTLFELANQLIDASLATDGRTEAALAAMDRLIEHVTHHFADEEALLERHRYDHLDAHRRAHARLLDRAVQLRADIQAGTVGLGEVVEFLAGQVVAKHLLGVDREFFGLFSV